VNVKLKASGLPTNPDAESAELLKLAVGLPDNFHERQKHLKANQCPVDSRIETFLHKHFADCHLPTALKLPESLILDRHGIARALSLPETGDSFDSS